MGLVQIRLVADTPDELERAIVALVALTAALGDRVRLAPPSRRGCHDEWLAYGTLETLGTPDRVTGASPAPSGVGGAGGGWTR